MIAGFYGVHESPGCTLGGVPDLIGGRGSRCVESSGDDGAEAKVGCGELGELFVEWVLGHG